MKQIAWVCGLNLAVLFAYSAVFASQYEPGPNAGLLFGMQMAFFVIGQAVFTLLTAGLLWHFNDVELAKAFGMATVVVLLVGFTTCLGVPQAFFKTWTPP